MNAKKSEKTPDILTAIDREESLSMMDPLLLSEHSSHRKDLTDLALHLVAKSAGFRRSLPSALASRWLPGLFPA